jgi:hypothetical protein
MLASRGTRIPRASSHFFNAPVNSAMFSFSMLATMPTFLIFMVTGSKKDEFS